MFGGLTVFGLAFLVVFREGFETVPFYEALLSDAPAIPVLAGLVAGAAPVAMVASLMLGLQARLAVAVFFNVTGDRWHFSPSFLWGTESESCRPRLLSRPPLFPGFPTKPGFSSTLASIPSPKHRSRSSSSPRYCYCLSSGLWERDPKQHVYPDFLQTEICGCCANPSVPGKYGGGVISLQCSTNILTFKMRRLDGTSQTSYKSLCNQAPATKHTKFHIATRSTQSSSP